MRIIDIVGNAVAQLDTENPYPFLYGADESDINKEADNGSEKMVAMLLPTFSFNANTIGVLSESYRCVLLIMVKTAFEEKIQTHKEAWGFATDAAKKLFMAIKSNPEVAAIASADNSIGVDVYDANYDILSMVVNISLRDNLRYC